MLEKIADRAKTLLDADTSAVFLPQPDSDELHADRGPRAPWPTIILADAITRGEGIIGDIAMTGRAELVNSTQRRRARRSRSPAPTRTRTTG